MDQALAISERSKSRNAAVKEFIPMLRELVVNGQKLTDQQIMGRATFAAEEGLDPITEVHTMVDKDGKTMGHTMAINGYRRKCLEQVGAGGSVDVEFVELEKIKLPNGAFCGWECRLRDSQSYGLWQKRVLEIGKTLREVLGTVSYIDLISACGPAPVTVGIGVVYASELNEWKDRSFNPIERCKKRAESNARKHRFPTNAPIYDAESQAVVSMGGAEEITFTTPAGKVEAPKKDAGQLLGELGYSELPPLKREEPIQEGQFTEAPAGLEQDLKSAAQDLGGTVTEPVPERPWTSEKISLEMAKTEKASTGALYWDMKTEDLAFRFNTIETALKMNGMTQDKKEAMTLKRDVVQAIMDHRAAAAAEAF